MHELLEKFKSVLDMFEDKYENLLVSGSEKNFPVVQDEWNEAWKDGGELGNWNEQLKFANQRVKKNDNPNTPSQAKAKATALPDAPSRSPSPPASDSAMD